MQIWTMQLSRWRLAKKFDIEVANITAKSGVPTFAPRFQDVMEYKGGQINETEYSALYLGRMQMSFVRNRVAWEDLKHKGNVAYACYCRQDVFCHRHLFVGLLTKWFDRDGVDYELMGELTTDNPKYVDLTLFTK